MFFFQAEDGIRDLVRSRGLGDVYKRQHHIRIGDRLLQVDFEAVSGQPVFSLILDGKSYESYVYQGCLLYTSDAADERSSVDLGGRRIIKKNKKKQQKTHTHTTTQ